MFWDKFWQICFLHLRFKSLSRDHWGKPAWEWNQPRGKHNQETDRFLTVSSEHLDFSVTWANTFPRVFVTWAKLGLDVKLRHTWCQSSLGPSFLTRTMRGFSLQSVIFFFSTAAMLLGLDSHFSISKNTQGVRDWYYSLHTILQPLCCFNSVNTRTFDTTDI